MCKPKPEQAPAACGHCHCHTHTPAPHGTTALWITWLPMAIAAGVWLWGMTANPFPTAEWLIFLAAYLPVGLPVLKDAFERWRQGNVFNEFTLMLAATLGAFAIGQYPEAVAVLLFYALGEFFQQIAVGRARRDIGNLASLRPDTAHTVAPDGSLRTLRPEQVTPGTLIEVKVGERVPLDAELLTDYADFDTAALTGESLPRTLKAGSEVSAGLIATGRAVRLRVLRPYDQSALQRILQLVEEAARHKAPAEQLMQRFARIYTPVVMALAVLIALLPPVITGGEWTVWLYRALVFLVVSCPCALVVSIPLCYFRGIGVASRAGILFKGGNYLDAVTRLKAMVFDKTGTLTAGTFAVEQITAARGFYTEQVLALTAALEQFSTHPVARAVAARAKSLLSDQRLQAEQVEEVAGKGMCGRVGGHTVVAGKPALLKERGIALPDDIDLFEHHTHVYCAIDGRYAGVIGLTDTLRPDAAQAIARLHRAGIEHIALLSGDRESSVEALARQLNIDNFSGNLLPADKVRALRRLKEKISPGAMAFAGDGINDAPVLALSDVGFAVGTGGTDAAVETADVVIHSNRLTRLADALEIGRRTQRTAWLNIALALGVKAAVLALGALGWADMWAAVVADTGMALICVANTYTIRPVRD